MAGYYAYLIGVDGRTSKRVDIVCDDDEEAKRLAKQMVDGHALELWQRNPQDRDVRTSCAYGRGGSQRLLGGGRRDGRSDESI
jgi:hypothetical protein